MSELLFVLLTLSFYMQQFIDTVDKSYVCSLLGIFLLFNAP